MFIDMRVKPSAAQLENMPKSVSTDNGVGEAGFSFNIKRLWVGAGLLIVILMFAIGTTFFGQFEEIHI